ncbi:hypothetical protein [Paenibacillus glucanolyticus]|uniref:hypothetical protein n=1 Tax=Paenibacillus glucanolyticus TaxID=59843 RepID=UPI00096C2D51|nr:hypothetical protein [Paenibacillus glucanolyticus]OMF76758.1 hypothetical protein BK142_14660 [Paenibacillus glucanolyticus]
MITVTCTNNEFAEEFLTEGEQYQAISSNGEDLTILRDDTGTELTTFTSRFELYVSDSTQS